MHSYSSLCHRMDMTEGRKLQSVRGKFIGDDGLFEAFEKRPDIVIGHIGKAVRVVKHLARTLWIS